MKIKTNFLEVEIEITEEDIRDGVKSHCTRCPVGLALQRALVSVGIQFVALSVSGRGELRFKQANDYPWIAISKEISTFTGQFDTGLPVQPFKVKLEFR